jgi:tetratricopeptide (TPR) repeat protein
MAVHPTFDVVLVGYRNDLARARTLEFLSRMHPAWPSLAPVDRAAPLPHRLFAALPGDEAQQIHAQLEEYGAQVALVGVAPADTPQGMPAALSPARSAGGGRLTVLLLVLLGVTVYWARQPRPVRPRLAAPQPLAPHLQPLGPAPRIEESAAAKLNADALQLAQAGQFRDAVQRLQEALRIAPDQPILTQNLQTMLFNWGVTDLASNRLDDAGDRFQQAAQLGERVEVLRALGVTYLRQGDLEHAASSLEQALQLAATDQSAMLALAEVYIREDRRPEAFDLLRRVKEAGAGGPELDKKLEQLSREVDAEWDFVQLQSRHFRVRFGDNQDTRTVRLMLDELEDAYDTVGAKLGAHPDERTPVVLYTQQDFHSITRTPDWAGAAFDGRIKIPVRGLSEDDPNLTRIVRHEYAHSLVAQGTGGHCPVWLNEGLAMWAEEEKDGDREPWAHEKIAGQTLFFLDELNGSFTQLPADRVEVAYAQSYLAVRSLVDRYGPRKIPALLSALGRSGNLSDAYAATYPGDLAGFEQQLLRQLAG